MNKLSNESQKLLKTIGIIFVMMLITYGIYNASKVLFTIMFITVLMCICIWFITFIILLIMNRNIAETWEDMNPIHVIKECFFIK